MRKINKNSVIIVTILVVSLMLGFTGPNTALAATSPALGTAASFSVLAKTLISNVPTSAISGDVGLDNAGSNYTGLTTAEVAGTIFDTNGTGPDAALGNNPVLMTSARADNTAAFGALSTVPNATCDTDYGAFTQDLVGLSLVPGVYCADAFTLSGTLTLNDTGAPNGVWIFRSVLSTLITSAGGVANVVFLTDVASACNVWWKVASSATLNTGTDFIGNILALTSITLASGSTLNGRAFAQNGAVTLDNNTISGCSTPLATLNVIKVVNGSGADPSDFSVHVTDDTAAEVTGSPQDGEDSPGTPYALLAGTYTVSEDAVSFYDQSFSGACDSNGIVVLADVDLTCTITNTYNPPSSGSGSATVQPPAPTPPPTPIAPTPPPTLSVTPIPIPGLPKTGVGANLPNLPWQIPVFIVSGLVLAAALIKRKQIT